MSSWTSPTPTPGPHTTSQMRACRSWLCASTRCLLHCACDPAAGCRCIQCGSCNAGFVPLLWDSSPRMSTAAGVCGATGQAAATAQHIPLASDAVRQPADAFWCCPHQAAASAQQLPPLNALHGAAQVRAICSSICAAAPISAGAFSMCLQAHCIDQGHLLLPQHHPHRPGALACRHAD